MAPGSPGRELHAAGSSSPVLPIRRGAGAGALRGRFFVLGERTMGDLRLSHRNQGIRSGDCLAQWRRSGTTLPGVAADANTTLLLDTLKAFNAGDLDTCLARMTPDFVMHYAELKRLRGGETGQT